MSDAKNPASTDAFPFLGGRPCLNLIATLGKRHAAPVERMPDESTLAQWLVAADLLPNGMPAEHLAVTHGQLQTARQLREAVSRIVSAARNRQPTDSGTPDGRGNHGEVDTALINQLASRPDLVPQLASGPGGSGHRMIWEAHEPVEAALSTLARDAILLLSGPDILRVKECGHPDCSLLFLDDSQAGRRRWCSMDRCGNRSKVSAYRSRGTGQVR